MSVEPTPRHRDSKSELLDAAREAIHDQEEKAKSFRLHSNKATSRTWVGVFGAIALAGLVVLIAQPEWLVGPAAPPVETPAVAVASVRLSLLRERQRVLDFTRRNGRLPATLGEAGGTMEGVTLRPLQDTDFELTAFAGDSVITLGAHDSMGPFLGDSFKTLRQRGAR